MVEKNALGRRSQSSITRSDAECCLSSHDRSVVRFASAHASDASIRSRRGNALPQSSNAACANAVSTHCIASVRAAARRRLAEARCDNARPIKQSVRHPRAYSNALSVCRFAACWSVRESNPRQPDYRSGALPTELTGGGLDIAFVKFHVRNTRHQPLILGAARRWPSDVKPACNFIRDAGGSRTHFKLLCRQPPGRLAPASSKCPRQESNLVFDLRRVACESGTPRGQCLSFSTPPRSRTPSCRFEVCRALRHTRKAQVARPGIEPDLRASEALERFIRHEPLRRVHECVFGVLALESEPVDPRL